MIKAIIWDMDGVLIDSEPHHMEAEIETFSKFGVKLTPTINKKYAGSKLIPHFEHLSKHFGIEDKTNELLETHRETTRKYAKEIFPLVDNVLEVLKELSKHYKMGIATSSEKELAELVFHRFELRAFFDAIVMGEDVKRSKPDPEPFIKAAKLLGVRSSECVAVEDSLNGFKAVKGAGMILIARKAPHNKNVDFSLADYIVGGLTEIPEILKKIESH